MRLPQWFATKLWLWSRSWRRSKPADFVIGGDYLHRWWVIKCTASLKPWQKLKPWTVSSRFINVFIHRVCRSDDDRALHDHPWWNISIILAGSYAEHTPDGIKIRKPGDVVFRRANAFHRLEVVDGPVTSIFITGRSWRKWGYDTPDGWVDATEFNNYWEDVHNNT